MTNDPYKHPSDTELKAWTGQTRAEKRNTEFKHIRRNIAADYKETQRTSHLINGACLIAVASAVGVLLAALIGGM